MDNQEKKKKMILLSALIAPVIVVMLIVLFANGENSNIKQEPKIDEASVPIPEVQEKGTNKKLSEYAREKLEKEKEKEKEMQKKEIDQYASQVFTGEFEKEEKQEEIKQENENIKNKEVKRSRVVQEKIKNRDNRKKEEIRNKEEKEEIEKDSKNDKRIVSSMGVIVNKTSSNKKEKGEIKSTNNSVETTKDYIPVTLDETIKIENGTMVVFVNKEEFKYKGRLIEKNSYIYCMADMRSERCILEAKRVKRTNGEIISIDKFKIYDERFALGLNINNELNKDTREAAGETVQEENNEIITGNLLLDAGTNVLRKTINKSANRRENFIILEEGYKVYLKYSE